MASFNKVLLMGNLTRDPQLKHLPNNTVVAEFGLAANRRYKTAAGEDKEEVAFVDCSAFGRQAETISQFCTKGKPLFVEGRLKFDTWDDRGGAGKRSKLTVVVENFQFLGRAGDDGASGSAGLPDFGGESSRPSAPPPRPIAEQQKMFAGEDRKWRGRAEKSGDKSPDKPGEKSTERPARNRHAGGKAASPVSEEQQFEDADIPF